MKKLPAEFVYYVRTAVWEFNSGLIFTSIWVLYYTVIGLSLVEVSLIYIVITIQNIPSQVRATVISMSSQTGMVGVLGISTGLGAYGDRSGVRKALALSGAILFPLILIYGRNARASPKVEQA